MNLRCKQYMPFLLLILSILALITFWHVLCFIKYYVVYNVVFYMLTATDALKTDMGKHNDEPLHSTG